MQDEIIRLAMVVLSVLFLLALGHKVAILRAGTGGELALLWWAPRSLTPHLIVGATIVEASIATLLWVRPFIGLCLGISLVSLYTVLQARSPSTAPCGCFAGEFLDGTRRMRMIRNAVILAVAIGILSWAVASRRAIPLPGLNDAAVVLFAISVALGLRLTRRWRARVVVFSRIR